MNSKIKTIINSSTGFICQFIILVLGFIIPKIILNSYGSDVNGLTNTITQIFTYMALLETGIASATKNVLYKPIQENNKNDIIFWICVSKKNYQKVSKIYFFLVIIFSIFLPFLLKTKVDYITILLYIFFEGLVGVISFYFINSWNCFFSVNGDNYIVNIFSLLVKILCYTVKIVLSLYSFNIALIQIGYFCVSLIQLFLYYIFLKRKYNWIYKSTKEYKKENINAKLPNRFAFIVIDLSWAIFSSTDMIVLSIFLSTKIASVYSVYNLVFLSLNSLLNAIYNSINYNLGQTYIKDINKYKKLHNLYNSLFMSAITILVCVCYFLIIPFIKLYTKGVDDINYIDYILPVLFCVIQLLSWSRCVASNLVNISGNAKKVSVVSIIESLLNIILSILFSFLFGIYGVLYATIVTLPINAIYLNWLSEKTILNRSPKKTILIFFVNFFIFFVTIFLANFIKIKIDNYFYFIFFGTILLVIYFILVSLINIIINRDVIIYLKQFFNKK